MEVESWTEVTTKGKRRKRELATQIIKPNNPPSTTLSLASIQADFNGKMKAWQACACRKTILSTLDRVQPESGWNIYKAICVGSGSFSRDNFECRKRSMWQFVVFVDTVQELQRHTRHKMDIDIFAQEPTYTDLDRAWLSTLRITILDIAQPSSGRGHTTEHMSNASAILGGLGPTQRILDDGTFLYEPFMDMNTQMAREILDADPALYIGSSMRGLLVKRDEVGALARLFDQDHDMYQFPPFHEDPTVLEGLGIYWKSE